MKKKPNTGTAKRKARAIEQPIPFERIDAMRTAIVNHAFKVETLDKKTAIEIDGALHVLNLIFEREKFGDRPSRADRANLTRTRTVDDLLRLPSIQAMHVSEDEVISAVFECQPEDPDGRSTGLDGALTAESRRTNQRNRRKLLATAYPPIQCDAMLVSKAYLRIVQGRKPKPR
jgi:hypothetical protein